MTQSSITEETIQEKIAEIEEQYTDVQSEITQIHKEGEELKRRLQQKTQEAISLKGQHKALTNLFPKTSRPGKKINSKKPKA
jgi:molecular chaperone GrpE (heat shock protein)